MSRLRIGPSRRRKGTGPEGDGPSVPDDLGAALASGRALADLPEVAEPSFGKMDKPRAPKSGVVLSRRAVVFWAAGVFVAFIWVFSLGVLVGRGTIYQNVAIQELENRLGPNKPFEAPPPEVITTPPPDPAPAENPTGEDLTFYDSLTKTKVKPWPLLPPPPQPFSRDTPKPETKNKPPAKHAPISPDKPKPTEKTKTKPSAGPIVVVVKKDNANPKAIKPVEEDPAKKVAVTSGVKTVDEAKSVAPAPERKPGENFTVQVAVADTIEEAERLAHSLRSQGFAPYFYEVQHKEKRYIRVRVGRYKTRAEAQQTMDKLAELGRKSMFISELVD